MTFHPGEYKLTAVYLMKNRWSEANYKIGVSSDPARRVLEVNDQYNVDAVVVAQVWLPRMFDAQCSETTWHRRLQAYRTDDHGGKEWFALTTEQVQDFIAWTEAGISRKDLSDQVFVEGMGREELLQYAKDLRAQIPHKGQKHHHRHISLWTSKTYSNDSENGKNAPTNLAFSASRRQSRRRRSVCTRVTTSVDGCASRQTSTNSSGSSHLSSTRHRHESSRTVAV